MTTVAIRIDENLKKEAEELFDDWGLNMTTAITCFIKKCVDTGVMPFTIGTKRTPHDLTLEAIAEAERIVRDPKTPRCSDPDKLEEFLFS